MTETARRYTIDDLYQIEGKAELIGGQLKIMDGTGFMPGRASGAVYRSLYAYERKTGRGYAVPDNIIIAAGVWPRQSFSPDAAFYVGAPPTMRAIQGAPVFAVEVRSEGDYGRRAKREMAAKRRDYFAAGTLVVWDVDLLNADTVRVFRDGNAEVPAAIYRRGELAEAEPAVPGWRFPVDELFD